MNAGVIKVTKAPPPVPVYQKAQNLIDSIITVATTPGPILAPSEVVEARALKCANECPQGLWNPHGNLGLGECGHRRCGCSKMKFNFAAMRCPLKVWGPYNA